MNTCQNCHTAHESHCILLYSHDVSLRGLSYSCLTRPLRTAPRAEVSRAARASPGQIDEMRQMACSPLRRTRRKKKDAMQMRTVEMKVLIPPWCHTGSPFFVS